MFPRPSMKLLRKLSEKAVEITGCGLAGGLSLNFVGEKEMAAVNEAFVGHSGPTDVICFDYRESKSVLPDDNDGDTVEVEIVICPAVARREAHDEAPAPRRAAAAARGRYADKSFLLFICVWMGWEGLE